MTLRRRLFLLLAIFGTYAALAAGVTIYANHWRIEGSLTRFERTIGQTVEVDRLQLLLAEQMLYLRDIVDGHRDALTPYTSARNRFATGLHQITAFSSDLAEGADWQQVLRLAEGFEYASNECLKHLDSGSSENAANVFALQLQGKHAPELRSHLVRAMTRLDGLRNASARELTATSSRILVLTITVAILAGALVLVGALLIRRWLMRPLSMLKTATQHYQSGDLAFRTTIDRRDELGEMGEALNTMAGAVGALEQKHRTLFSNLRDAVVICDDEGRIVEYHDGDSHILSVDENEHVGRHFLEVWPEWRSAVRDWDTLIHCAVADGRRHEVASFSLSAPGSGTNGTFADFIIYRVEYGEHRYAAIVIRNATERNRLQRRVRQSETMQAVGTMAGGLAHDVNNLLSGVVATLSRLTTSVEDERQSESITAALQSCKRAAGLSKRLLNFARGAQGTLQRFAPGDVVNTVIDSMDESYFAHIAIVRDLDASLSLFMDQDQFAQIVLNLCRNARDAMASGGTLKISLCSVQSRHPDSSQSERPHVCLEVADSGTGMSPDVAQRIFEPFFSTKSGTDQHGRGMGMAVVHSAVNNAGGFIQVESKPDTGTTIRVFVPFASEGKAGRQSNGSSLARTD